MCEKDCPSRSYVPAALASSHARPWRDLYRAALADAECQPSAGCVGFGAHNARSHALRQRLQVDAVPTQHVRIVCQRK